jgi:hypothetical protein
MRYIQCFASEGTTFPVCGEACSQIWTADWPRGIVSFVDTCGTLLGVFSVGQKVFGHFRSFVGTALHTLLFEILSNGIILPSGLANSDT